MSKRLGGIIGYKDKTSSWHLNGFPDDSNIGSTVLLLLLLLYWTLALWSQRGTKVNGYHM